MSTLHQQHVDRIIQRFEETPGAQTVLLTPDAWLYEFVGTNNAYIRFIPHTKDGKNWYMYVWTLNKCGSIQDPRSLIHALLSNGYTSLINNYYRDKRTNTFTIEYVDDEVRRSNAPSNGKKEFPLCHILAMYKKTGKNIYFRPMYTNVVPGHHEPLPSEAKTQSTYEQKTE